MLRSTADVFSTCGRKAAHADGRSERAGLPTSQRWAEARAPEDEQLALSSKTDRQGLLTLCHTQ